MDPSWPPESKNVDGKIRNRFCPVLEPVFRSARFALLWLTQGSYRNGRGIHGSGLTWGFQKYPFYPFSGSGLATNPEKRFFRFALLWHTQDSYRNGRGIHGSGLTQGFQWYPEIRFSGSGSSGKTGKTGKTGKCLWHLKLKLFASLFDWCYY